MKKGRQVERSVGRLFVIRHGQTEHNASHILQGPRIDTGLSDLGQRQAAALAAAMAKEPLSVLFTSPLVRARETAQAVVQRHPGQLAQQVVPELYEVDYGHFIGRRVPDIRDELEQVFDAWRMGFPDQAFPGGESALVAQHRVRPFAERLLEEGTAKDIAVVSHGRINRILLATLTGRGMERLDEFPQSNAGITELAVEDGAARVVRLDDTSHLALEGHDSFS